MVIRVLHPTEEAFYATELFHHFHHFHHVLHLAKFIQQSVDVLHLNASASGNAAFAQLNIDVGRELLDQGHNVADAQNTIRITLGVKRPRP